METSREQALRDAGAIPPVDAQEDRAQREAVERPERLKRLREKTETLASLRENGEPDVNTVSFLFDSKHNFEMIEETEKRILGNGKFDQKKAQRFFAGLYGADRRFDEPLDAFIARAEKACRATEYDVVKVKDGLLPLVADGTFSQIEADEIADMIERKDVASVGRKFGKKMSKISPILRASERA